MPNRRSIGLIGTLGRVVLGVVFLAIPVVAGTKGGLQWYEAALGLLVAPAALLGWQLIRARWSSRPMNATGPAGFAVNFVIGAVFFMFDPTRDAAFVFYGASLLIAALRGYAGCEVLAISNWVLGRDDQVGCVVFSPIDAMEERMLGAADSR